MLTLQDCIAFSGLTPDQLEAVAKSKHLADVLAAEWVECVLDQPGGCELLEALISQAIDAADANGDGECVDRYRRCLAEFLDAHPHCQERRRRL